jgi:hypothetical protein
MSVYLRALWRFKWIVLLGVVVAVLTPVPLLYHLRPLQHGKFVSRSQVSYIAGTQLIVNNPTSPYLRADLSTIQPSTTPRVVVKKPQAPKNATTTTAAKPAQPSSSSPSANTNIAANTRQLIQAANLFPVFILSDEVSILREQMVGHIAGAVTAKALYSLQSPNKYRPSALPIIQILANAPKPENAVKLANSTARAFNLWLVRKQNRSNVPYQQRIIVRPLNVADRARATGGPSYSLPVIAALAVFALFCGIAVILDRQLPKRQEEKQSETTSENVAAPELSDTTATPMVPSNVTR